MNSITREKKQQGLQLHDFGTDADGREWKFQRREHFGNGQRKMRIGNADTFTTETLKPCRNLSDSSDMQGQKAITPAAAEFTYMSEQTDTLRGRSETLQTSWRAMKTS